MFNRNLILASDSYKASHFLQYPPNTTHVSSYIEARAGGEYQMALFFGLQMFLKQVLSKPITADDIDEAEMFLAMHGEPFNRAGWSHVLNKHGGYLPLMIEAVAEGTVLPVGNVMVQVRNTDSEVPWLTSFIETSLLRAVWYPTTVATQSWYIKRDILESLERTSDDPNGQILFKLHDFGARGVSSAESAAIGGCAHLVNFRGSDTIEGILAAQRYYSESMAGFSIPAAEHSTITTWDREVDAYSNMLDQFSGTGKLLAVVSDSYDLFGAIANIWGGALKERVVNCGGTVVIRPDSGVPEDIVPRVIEELAKAFPETRTNKKGYMVLPPYVRVIQGDGINRDSIGRILSAMDAKKQSTDNIAFGMGGALLQHVNRDTMRFAMKASNAIIKGWPKDVSKRPLTDLSKSSKAGVLALVGSAEEGYRTVRREDALKANRCLLPVYTDGALSNTATLAAIRQRADDHMRVYRTKGLTA